MGIDKDRIYALIAQRPQIRTVEIADIIDCEPEQIEPALASEIAMGRIIVHQVTAPNGRPANGFEFSRAFLDSDAYRTFAASIDIDSAPAAPVAASQSTGVTATAAASAPAPAPNKPAKVKGGIQWRGERAATSPAHDMVRVTHPERAIQFLRDRGGRTDNESMRNALGLGPGASPASYLRVALASGRLVREGRDWMLGPEADATTRYTTGVIKSRALLAPEQTSSAFRCGRWSDGVLELQRDGRTIATLAPDEQATISAFLAPSA